MPRQQSEADSTPDLEAPTEGWPDKPLKTQGKKKMPGAPDMLTHRGQHPRPAWMDNTALLPKRPPTRQHAVYELPIEDRRTTEQGQSNNVTEENES